MHRHSTVATSHLIVHCPFCQSLLANEGTLSGRMAYCPSCLNPFQMPGQSTLPVARAATPDSLARSVPAVIRKPLDSLPTKGMPAERPRPEPSPPLPAVDRIPWHDVGTPSLESYTREPARPVAPALSAPPVVAVLPAALVAAPNVAPVAPVASPAPSADPPVAIEGSQPMKLPGLLAPAIQSEALAALPPPAYSGPPPAIVTDEPAPWQAEDSPYFADLSTSGNEGAVPTVHGPFPALGPTAEVISEVPADLAAPLPDADPEAEENRPFHLHEQFPAFVTSAVTHAVLLIALAMWIITQEHAPTLDLLAEWSPTNHATLETTPFEIKLETPTAFDPSLQPESSVVEPAPFHPAPAGFEVQAPEAVEDVRGVTPSAAPVKGIAGKPSGFDGRGEGQRQRLLREGGSAESESAVALGLKWLKEHQYPDGGWRFDHSRCPNCKGQCDDPGMHDSTTGATALALLPFLGAGQTHQQGKYQEVVRKGLYFLMKQQEGRGNEAGDFRGEDGDMYCHGLASTALCEAYGMTRDKMLMVPAQKSLDFIVAAQDQRGGGWRYQPKQRGDTSIVGWQVMALKSGHMAYLKVPKATITKAAAYLESVESESGAFYGYTSPGRGTPATTAIGLLCRMHMGWSKEHPGIVLGVQELTQEAPSRSNMYFNYYATQVLRQYGGAPWTQWNNIMREQLINTQVKNGHEEGSWAGRDSHLNEGGRLYVTALSIMTLEVYYRHMPLYKEDAVKNDFRP